METDTDPLVSSGTARKDRVFHSQHNLQATNQLTSGEERSRAVDWARPSRRRASQNRDPLLSKDTDGWRIGTGRGKGMRRNGEVSTTNGLRRKGGLNPQERRQKALGRQEALLFAEPFDPATETLPSCNRRETDLEPGVKPTLWGNSFYPWRERHAGKAFSDRSHFKVPAALNSFHKFYQPERESPDFKVQDSFRQCERRWLQPESSLNKPSFSQPVIPAFNKQADEKNPAKLFTKRLGYIDTEGPTFEAFLKSRACAKEPLITPLTNGDKWGRGNSTTGTECLKRESSVCLPGADNYLPKPGEDLPNSPARRQAEQLLSEFRQFLNKRAVSEEASIQAGSNPGIGIPTSSPRPMLEINQPMDCSIGLIEKTDKCKA